MEHDVLVLAIQLLFCARATARTRPWSTIDVSAIIFQIPIPTSAVFRFTPSSDRYLVLPAFLCVPGNPSRTVLGMLPCSILATWPAHQSRTSWKMLLHHRLQSDHLIHLSFYLSNFLLPSQPQRPFCAAFFRQHSARAPLILTVSSFFCICYNRSN